MRKLIIGPWVGEFGWELCCWQGLARYTTEIRRKINEDTHVHVICRESSQYLYKDFATSFEFIDPKGETDSENCIGYRFAPIPKDTNEEMSFLSPKDLRKHWIKWYSGECPYISEQIYIQFGTKTPELEYDIVIHARSTNKCGTDIRNWSREKWEELISLLENAKGPIRIACIGAPGAAMMIRGTSFIGADLETISNVLASSKLAIGPSSGPMHLASLCKTPHIVWTGDNKNLVRYRSLWNPFSTKNHVMDPDEFGWDPHPKDVAACILSKH